MFERVYFIPQPAVGTAAQTGKTQMKIAISTTSTNRILAALLIQFAATISGTAPGTARGLSQAIVNIEVQEEDGTVHHIDGAALMLSSIDAMVHVPQLMYQALTDTVTAATGVQAVAQYSMCGPFKGHAFTVTVNVNNATATGYTAVSAANYVATVTTMEIDKKSVFHAQKALSGKITTNVTIQPEAYPILNGRYVVDSKYQGAAPCSAAYVGFDNVELSTVMSILQVASSTYSPQECTMAEDGLMATIPYGLAQGTAFAGCATLPLKNAQTGNAVGLGYFSGPTPAPLLVSIKASETILLLERQQR